ncbi:MAG: hypothetical protein LBU40_00305 [Methanobrevibacter sp.]|jgi:hypothetical protein|nr:hypothetical protein [Methanobrevibacter sp.]
MNELKSFKIPQRYGAILIAIAIIFVENLESIKANIPHEYSILSTIISILGIIALQLLVEKRIVRAEDLKVAEYENTLNLPDDESI